MSASPGVHIFTKPCASSPSTLNNLSQLAVHLAGVEEEGAGDEEQRVAGEDAVPQAADQLRDDQRGQLRLAPLGRQPVVHICKDAGRLLVTACRRILTLAGRFCQAAEMTPDFGSECSWIMDSRLAQEKRAHICAGSCRWRCSSLPAIAPRSQTAPPCGCGC